jgi:hypothetical protein
LYADKIFQFPPHEFDIEAIIIEIKSAIVDDEIGNAVAVYDAECAVPKNRVQFLTGSASNQ